MSEPIQPEFPSLINVAARHLDKAFNGERKKGEEPKVKLVLMFAKFDKDGSVLSYIANGNTDDMLASLRKHFVRAEGSNAEPPKGDDHV